MIDRQGVALGEYKAPVKIAGAGEAQRCFYPFKIEPYGRGCSHNCLYCYARSCNDFRGQWDPKRPYVTRLSTIRDVFKSALYHGRTTGKLNKLIRSQVPVRIGSFTDCYGAVEDKWRNTRKLIQMLNAMHYPYMVMTKSDRVLEDADLLNPNLCYVQFSVSTPDDEKAKIMEPGAPPTSKRLDALRQLHEAGFWTAARINPMFPTHRDGYHSRGIKSEEHYHFGWELVDQIAEAGADTLIAGFLRLSPYNLKWIKEATGEDLRWLFPLGYDNLALHFSTEEKRWYYERAKAMCDERDMRFSVCYDGDDAYTEFRYLWANQNDCCDGLGNIPAFKRTFGDLRRVFGIEEAG